ncbi:MULTISPECIES: YeeE/YedE family protein [Photobacterium]|uniref:YeeE/YedE family protein n=1 Tax=Photobacterium TaxID=657 RepID=UPI001C2D1C96|nr:MULTISPECIES: YeeE/YedE family protein [Photobacterium]MBV1840968.1 YeeE/YedE family protein [Photobacterium ganghwense]
MSARLVSSLIALFSGVLFGMGMMVSGMVDPVNVLGFLDLAGEWDPSLAFVMGGALLVFAPAYLLIIRKRPQPVCEQTFHLSKKKDIDSRLIAGSVLFGLGWGIAGICPGPALTSLSGGSFEMLVFVVSMILGIVLSTIWASKREKVVEITAQ